MIVLIKQLINLLSAHQRKKFFRLQILIIIMAFFEILAVASIGPFMALVGNQKVMDGNGILASLYENSGFTEPYDFIFIVGVVVLLLMTVGSLISMLTTWKLAHFSTKIGAEIGDRLYQHYLFQPWLFHSTGSSAQLTKQIATETTRVTNQILSPLMRMNAKIILVAFIVIGLFVFNPIVASITFLIFTLAYVLLYKVIRKRLVENGKFISSSSTVRYKLMSEGFGGIKDVLLLGRQKEFVDRFRSSGEHLAYSQGTNQALAQAPRYLIELVAFGAIILFVLYLIKFYQGDLGQILPMLGIYSLAGFKLLPALQQIYASIAAIKGGMASFESIKQDLSESVKTGLSMEEDSDASVKENKILEAKLSIALKDVFFTYPGKGKPAIKGVNINIPANATVGFVGASGAGKSTLIDMLLGLIEPQKGRLLVDGEPITEMNRKAWQNTVGYVPQSIFLSDNSITENIAFGVNNNNIDINKVKRAAKMANLDALTNDLPDGLNTRVGERGVQLSGGQRQRIGIARCLYQEASVLIFDEATSALDGLTEKQIMNAIYDFSGKKTVIMIAHRIKTVEKCDIIYLMQDGSVIDHGSYNDLIERNANFREIANSA